MGKADKGTSSKNESTAGFHVLRPPGPPPALKTGTGLATQPLCLRAQYAFYQGSLPCTLSHAPTLPIRNKAPATTASPSWTPGPGLQAREQTPGTQDLGVAEVRADRARRTSVYLRLVPQRGRRHRALRAERGREQRARRGAGTAVSIPGLVRGTRAASPSLRPASAAGSVAPSGPSLSGQLSPKAAARKRTRPRLVNNAAWRRNRKYRPTLWARTEPFFR